MTSTSVYTPFRRAADSCGRLPTLALFLACAQFAAPAHGQTTFDPPPGSTFAQIAGQAYADFATVEIKSVELFSDALFNRMMGSRDGLAPEPGAGAFTPAHAWASGLGGWGAASAHGDDTLGLAYTLAGGAAGVDYHVNSFVMAGSAFAYMGGGVSERGGADSGGIESCQGAFYASLGGRPWYVDGLVGYAYGAENLERAISFTGVDRAATGAPVANTVFAAIEGGYTVNVGHEVDATPFVRMQMASVSRDAFTETGAGALSLAEAEQTTGSARGVIGAQLNSALQVGSNTRADIRTRVGWAHDYAGTDRELTAAFVGTPGADFTVNGARIGADSLIVQAGASAAVWTNGRLFVSYHGDMSGKDTLNAVTGGVRFAW